MRSFLLALLVFAGCDSLHMAEIPVGSGEYELIAEARRWYEEALTTRQEERRVEKFSNAEILEAMVAAYPPDWTQAVTLSVPDNDALVRVATILGAEQPEASVQSDSIDIVRTISLDLNSSNDVVNSRLLEFASPDSLESDNFAQYVRQWQTRDFGNMTMMVREFDINYDSKICEIYRPGQDVEVVDISLVDVSGLGKTTATYYCYLSRITQICLCLPHGGDPNYDEECDEDTEGYSCGNARQVYTCVREEEGYGGGDDEDGDGGGSGGGGGGGRGGDDEDDGEDESSRINIAFTCPSRVIRGNEPECTVTSDSLNLSVLTVDWSSSLGPTASGVGLVSWKGLATETATISVSIGSYFSASREIEVAPRFWSFGKLNSPVRASSQLRAQSLLGLTTVSLPKPIRPGVGTGPWGGRIILARLPEPTGLIEYANDYSNEGPAYQNANTTCTGASGLNAANYHQVNEACQTLASMNTFKQQIVEHERYHEEGYDQCLGSSTAEEVAKELEKMIGSSSDDLAAEYRKIYGKLWAKLRRAGAYAPPPPAGSNFWFHDDTRWLIGQPIAVTHPVSPRGC